MSNPNPLHLPIEQSDLPNLPTVGHYLAEILSALLDEGEDFSAKRPLGNSDWEGNIDNALAALYPNPGAPDAEITPWRDLKEAVVAALTAPAAPDALGQLVHASFQIEIDGRVAQQQMQVIV